jgi:hypothetical protein
MELDELRVLVQNLDIDPFVPLPVQIQPAPGNAEMPTPRTLQNFGLDEVALGPGHAVVKSSLSPAREHLPQVGFRQSHDSGDGFAGLAHGVLLAVGREIKKGFEEALEIRHRHRGLLLPLPRL